MAVHGAALHKSVEKQLREELSAYGIDMREYTCKVEGYYEHDPELLLSATFTRTGNEAQIEINDIYTSKATGEVLQRGMPVLH